MVWYYDDKTWPEPNITNFLFCGPVTPHGDIDVGQHWLRKFLAAWQHQAIIWTHGGLVYWRIYASLGLNELKLSVA